MRPPFTRKELEVEETSEDLGIRKPDPIASMLWKMFPSLGLLLQLKVVMRTILSILKPRENITE